MKPDAIIVCGPTGIGKTSVAIKIAKACNGQIINADSMQLYRYMDIGTAKPTPEERAMTPHHIVDMITPDTQYDAARFAEQANELIHQLTRDGFVPIVAGGTGLYIKALVDGLFRASPANPEILKRLSIEAENFGTELLYKRLSECDPGAAAKIHPNDTFRIVRALEIYETTGMPISDHHRRHGFSERHYRTLKIGLSMEREALYERINARVDNMLDEGLLNEVRNLIEMGYDPSLKPMKSLGYRHMAEFIRGEKDWQETVRTLKRDTRRYAKRQLTWFRADTEIEWYPPVNIHEIMERVNFFLEQQNN